MELKSPKGSLLAVHFFVDYSLLSDSYVTTERAFLSCLL